MARVGDVVGPYRIEDLLGEGGMGEVFRASDMRSGQVVALKLMKTGFADGDERIRRLLREARTARAVDHHHLVGLIDAGEAEGRHYLALEYMPGPTLAARLRTDGPLALDDVVRVALEVADGLDALHAAGIVHRDVKPSNILFAADGGARLTDFGLAKGHDFSDLTRPGQMLGTIDYLAPEIIRGETPTAASDLYAFGCTIYTCVAGGPPYAGGVLQVGAGHLSERPPALSARREGLPDALNDQVLSALRKQPSERPATATQYARLLAAAAVG